MADLKPNPPGKTVWEGTVYFGDGDRRGRAVLTKDRDFVFELLWFDATGEKSWRPITDPERCLNVAERALGALNSTR